MIKNSEDDLYIKFFTFFYRVNVLLKKWGKCYGFWSKVEG